MKQIIDISWPISSAMTAYKDRSVVEFNEVKRFERDKVRETTITLSSHSGTHVDAPSHFLQDGKVMSDLLPDRFIGDCVVFDMLDSHGPITRDSLVRYDGSIAEGSIVVLKTTNSNLACNDKFNPQFSYLDQDGAAYLVEKRVKAVGIDYLGIEHSQPGHPTHALLMKADIGIIEGLRLVHVKPGAYLFICLPLHIVGLEAAPARAILISKD